MCAKEQLSCMTRLREGDDEDSMGARFLLYEAAAHYKMHLSGFFYCTLVWVYLPLTDRDLALQVCLLPYITVEGKHNNITSLFTY